MHFRWNRDRLIDRYSDAQSSVLKEVGEPVDEEDAGALESISPPSQSAPNGLHPIAPPAFQNIDFKKPESWSTFQSRLRPLESLEETSTTGNATRDVPGCA